MNIQWTDDALWDLRALRHYIANDNPKAANKVAKKILATINLLSDHPEMGRPGRIYGTRELIVSGTSFLVPYQVKNNTLTILRVFHMAMQWPDISS